MIKTQILLPDELYEKAKQFAAEREISLAEVTRRSLELLLDRYPENKPTVNWNLPIVDGGNVMVELRVLKSISADEADQRSLP